MPDWTLSLVVLLLGLIGLVLVSIGVHRTIGAMVHWLDPVDPSRFAPWLALVTLLPALAVTLQVVGSGADALVLGAIIGVHVLGVLLAIGSRSTPHLPSRRPFAPPALLPPRGRSWAEPVHHPWSRAWSLVGAAGLVWGLVLNGDLGRGEGALLVLLCLLYLTWMGWTARPSASSGDDTQTQAPPAGAGHQTRPARGWWRLWGLSAHLCVGLTLLAMGARVLAMGALDLALVLGLDHWMLGLTLLAPASVIASWLPILLTRWWPSDGASGWTVPSLAFDFNLVNLLGLVGLTALTAPDGLQFRRETLWASWPLVILTSLLAAVALIRAESARSNAMGSTTGASCNASVDRGQIDDYDAGSSAPVGLETPGDASEAGV